MLLSTLPHPPPPHKKKREVESKNLAFLCQFKYNYIKLRHSVQIVCKRRSQLEVDKNSNKTWDGKTGTYGTVLAKINSSSNRCACKNVDV